MQNIFVSAVDHPVFLPVKTHHINFVKLAKTIAKPMVFIDFARFGPSKIDPKTIPKRNLKKHLKKKTRQNRF